MIENNLLSDRLNTFKNNSDSNNLSSEDIHSPLVDKFIRDVSSAVILIIKALIFGYSIKIIFNITWNFWQVTCVGLAVHFLMLYIHSLIHD